VRSGRPPANLDRIANDQYHDGRHLPIAQAQAGDLVFWANNTSDWRTIHHVAIYAGYHRIVEAPHTGTNVRIRKLDRGERFRGGLRRSWGCPTVGGCQLRYEAPRNS
jgi:cell wall-associated NlpC family hydrolase